MVRNVGGGKVAKGQARKRSGPSAAVTKLTLRKSEDPMEIYAQVTRILGGGMCHVITPENQTLLCHIRGKFRGRGKRDNFVGIGTWLLVGLRSWESTSTSSTKLNNCDVIEVYSEADKEMLKQTVNSVNWSIFVANDARSHSISATRDGAEDDGVDFETEQMQEARRLAELQAANDSSTLLITDEGNQQIISVDDI